MPSSPFLHHHFARCVLVSSLCALAASGCESAEQKCFNARSAAQSEWTAYVNALDQARATAVATRERNQRRLTLDVQRRLYPQSEQKADAQYDRDAGAWLRAQKKAFQELCNQDKECSGLEHENSEVQAVINDLDERLPLARAALSAVGGDPEQERLTAKAAIIHPEFPQLKQAQALGADAIKRCSDVPKSPEAVSAR